MKKIISILSVITLVIIGFSLNSCVKDKDYETPQINCEEPEIPATQMTTIQHIIDAWYAINPGPQDRTPYEFAPVDAAPVYVAGYVISSDKDGNFYKELFIQDDPANPTRGIKVGIDMRSLFAHYDMGRKIYIQLNGLAVNKSHGEFVIGELDGNSVRNIRENVAKKIIKRSCSPEVLSPKVINSVNDITDDMLGTYIALDNMQFFANVYGKSFVDPNDSYDTHRLMKSCTDGNRIKLETSTYASFKDNILPEGSGKIEGILTRDYSDSYYVIRVNGLNSFSFDGPRCDSPCNISDVTGQNVIFSEDFESYSTNSTNIGSWINVNVNGGNNLWKVKNYSGNKYAQCSAHNSNENPLEAWLISPPIDLDNSTDEQLSFKTKTGYNNGQALMVFVSTDFTGNPADISNATWLEVDADLADGPSTGYMNYWVDGKANLSCLNGTVYIAFRYLGGDGGITTTFQVDDVKVTAN